MKTRMNYAFIILFGVVNLFADMTYEGARSIHGPFLALLGANGFIVGVTAGLGELIGYAFRYLSGAITDRSQKYWPIILIGYVINLAAVPLLAFAGSWEMASTLIVLERFGRAIRTPPRDAVISFATKEMGRGWGFGLLESLDQLGAMIGPLVVSGILYLSGNYYLSFAVLALPAFVALAVLTLTKISYPAPQLFENEKQGQETEFEGQFWIYLAALSLFGAGFIDFAMAAFHFKKIALFSDSTIPLLYAAAMGLSGFFALLFGKVYDKKGVIFFIPAFCLSAVATPLLFLGGQTLAAAGVFLWSIGMGVQESIMLAYVADLAPKIKRATAFGLFYLVFGASWFLGSVLIGWLYDVSIIALILFSCAIQLAPIPLVRKLYEKNNQQQ